MVIIGNDSKGAEQPGTPWANSRWATVLSGCWQSLRETGGPDGRRGSAVRDRRCPHPPPHATPTVGRRYRGAARPAGGIPSLARGWMPDALHESRTAELLEEVCASSTSMFSTSTCPAAGAETDRPPPHAGPFGRRAPSDAVQLALHGVPQVAISRPGVRASPFQSRNEPEAAARESRLTGDRISGSKQGSWRGLR